MFFFLLIPRPPSSTLFPYTTLFRSAKKSPGIAKAMAPLFKIDKVWREETNKAMAEWKKACDETPKEEQEPPAPRSEEHTSELQSRPHLVCRLLLEKKKKKNKKTQNA